MTKIYIQTNTPEDLVRACEALAGHDLYAGPAIDYPGMDRAADRLAVGEREQRLSDCNVLLVDCTEPTWTAAAALQTANWRDIEVHAVVDVRQPLDPWLESRVRNRYGTLDDAIAGVLKRNPRADLFDGAGYLNDKYPHATPLAYGAMRKYIAANK